MNSQVELMSPVMMEVHKVICSVPVEKVFTDTFVTMYFSDFYQLQ